jgi:hypothetical protein
VSKDEKLAQEVVGSLVRNFIITFIAVARKTAFWTREGRELFCFSQEGPLPKEDCTTGCVKRAEKRFLEDY